MDMKLDASRWRRRRGMAKLLDALGAGEGLTRYVGGAVRDQLLKLPVSDIDLATRLRPDEVIERLEAAEIKAVPTGIDHGTITAVSDGQPVEVTTLRRDVSTDGRRATVAFTDDWKEDAARRDFTINALMADPASGEMFDYFGGLADLEARRVRFIGDPLQRIAEDHLRILRFFRFHARFGAGEPDGDGLDACTARANDLMALSRERIADELLKLLAVTDPCPTVELMLGRDILKPVIPEIERSSVGAASAAWSPPSGTARSSPKRSAASRLCCRPIPTSPTGSRRGSNCRTARASGWPARPRAMSRPSRASSPTASARNARPTGLLLAGQPADAAAIAGWTPPRLPIAGGDADQARRPAGPRSRAHAEDGSRTAGSKPISRRRRSSTASSANASPPSPS